MEDTARTAGGKLGEYAYTARSTDKSAADLLRDIITNVQEMVRFEVRLAKAEFREETEKTLAAAKKLGIASIAGMFAVGFVLERGHVAGDGHAFLDGDSNDRCGAWDYCRCAVFAGAPGVSLSDAGENN